ncbi:hypothetical protein MNBD_ALPHA12-1857 [hydrothermal vent metagenome]|uniref:Uncharacterized protein n=1 Tax=hydrothermal vent metagenome TaxID=652676 RepID=A0A3B0TZU7_9ZZZZ
MMGFAGARRIFLTILSGMALCRRFSVSGVKSVCSQALSEDVRLC